MTLPPFIQSAISEIFAEEVRAASAASGGCINEASSITLQSGKKLFAKWNRRAQSRFFEAEAMGLRILADADVLVVPEVLTYADSPEHGESYLLLEHLEPGRTTADAERRLGQQLAALHTVTEEEFGFLVDNFIGETPQHNNWRPTWDEFFLSERLLPQLKIAEKRGWARGEFAREFLKKESVIRAMLVDCDEAPALIHGDLWGGNVFWSTRGPALIDPATYYGNREAEIAFTELFGGFSAAFYEGYREVRPLDAGYESRRDVHNLYHVMNHANLFGGSYEAQSLGILKSL